MATVDEKAVEFIFGVVNELDNKAEVLFDRHSVNLFIYRFRVISKGEEVDFQFPRALMDDFKIAIEKYKGTDYYYTLENALRFEVYIVLGSRGLLTDFDISEEILKEKGEWLKRCSVAISFDAKMTEALNNGLKRLSDFIGQVASAHNLDLKDMLIEKDYIDGLIEYSEKNGHLNSEGVGVESLGFLKAGAVCEIIEKEKQRSQLQIPRVKKEIVKDIYRIVQTLRRAPFLGIKLPECIHDYNAAYKRQSMQSTQQVAPAKHSYQKGDRLDALLDGLDPNLKKKRAGAWLTFESENPDRLSQSANSMVELLDRVIGLVCVKSKLAEVLSEKYCTSEETQWIDATRFWISQTKSKLHRVKHHPDYKADVLARSLLESAENIMIALLE
jgi:hypothetical protein